MIRAKTAGQVLQRLKETFQKRLLPLQDQFLKGNFVMGLGETCTLQVGRSFNVLTVVTLSDGLALVMLALQAEPRRPRC